MYLERECPMDRYSEILGQGHLERKSSLQIFNEYQGPLDSHKGYNSNTVSLQNWDIRWVKDYICVVCVDRKVLQKDMYPHLSSRIMRQYLRLFMVG